MGIRSKHISSEISQRIRSLRTSKNLTQKELSEMLFKSESAIRMWELGKSEPDLQTVNRLSEIFNVDVDYLLGRSDFIKQEPTAQESEGLPEDIIIYHRDGKTVRKQFSKELSIVLNKEEQEMLDLFRGIPKEQRSMVIRIIRAATNT